MARKALGAATLQIVQAIEVHIREPMLVACSGGADSLALAACAAIVGRRQGLSVRAVVIDHQLQSASAAVSQKVKQQLESIDIPTAVIKVTVGSVGGMEAAARQARYAALTAHVEPAEVVLLGHTLDDQAENVLLGLARGSGTRSLSGMAASRDIFRRPLLGLRREVTRLACQELELQWWEDPHNSDTRYARVRVRTQVIPMLEELLDPGVSMALARSAIQLRQDADCLDELAATQSFKALVKVAAAPDTLGLDARYLARIAPALQNRIIMKWLRSMGATDLTAAHIAAVSQLVTNWRGQKQVIVPKVQVIRRNGVLIATKYSKENT